ncbi:ABC transporter permease [Actinoplanes couchii]|uniref:ABC transporter n=1 Tax=Actinoplanes couchii TaxID=403638 RepID=A0ABQ3X606_9ACTN|nr:FtsX-like permease family protein [Actinoplanes couchii]MDR6325368.1 putative ABC transport system permease protein [Actinoplanes couchii]GID53929.1 ABC transporter [Actinoplanes couchii]
MLSLVLRTAKANLTRALLSSLSVVLGVAFVSGSLMFTDGLSSMLTAQAATQYDNVDVGLSMESISSDDDGGALIGRVRKVDGVRAAEPVWSMFNIGLSFDGGARKVLGDHKAVNVSADPGLQPIRAAEGRMPAAAGEIVLDKRTASREGIPIGATVQVSNFGSEAREYRLVGLTSSTKGGFDTQGALVVMATPDMAAMAGYPATTIVVSAADGVSPDDLAARLGAAVGIEARTHDQLVRSAMDSAVGNAEEFRNALLGFGVIAVCMAAFVIANTFTIVLAQRTRETALLRLIGSTRRQVFRSVLVEAAVIGFGGSVLGLGAGVLLALGLPAALASVGAPSGVTPVLSGGTVLIAMAVGVGVTMVSAMLPARRGTAVPPVAALGDASVQVARPAGRFRMISGGLVAAIGAGLLAIANQVGLVVGGALLAVTGFLLLSPAVVPALVRVVSKPFALLGGATVSLALANAVRNPRRIATTTNALVVGVTLIATVTLLAKSTEAPSERAADEKMFAHFLVTGSTDTTLIPDELATVLRDRPEVGTVYPSYQVYDDALNAEVLTAGRDAPAQGSALVSAGLGIAVGGTVTVQGQAFPVAGVRPGDRTVWLTADDIKKRFEYAFLTEVQVEPPPGVAEAEARATLDRVLNAFPSAVAYNKAEYVDRLNARMNQALAVVTALLSLAVIIALVGVANTLTLSVVERTRENAMLRAIGLTRRQLRLTLSAEALVMALTGTIIGTLLSIGIAISGLKSVAGDGDGLELTIPWDRLAVLLAIAALAALTASVIPARRAVRDSITANLAAE